MARTSRRRRAWLLCAGAALASFVTPPPARAETTQPSLTPIGSGEQDARGPAYQLYAEIDVPILAIGAVFAGARIVRTQKAYCAPRCDEGELNRLDRVTAGRWDPKWALASDLGVYGVAVGAAGLLALDEGIAPALNDAVVVAQSALSATAITTVLTIASGRPRPLLYGDRAPEDVRNGSDAGMSFLSSHTAVTFAIATSSWMTMRRLHPRGSTATWVLVAGLAVGAFVGTARVLAGKHFITDAIGGAVVGSSTGVLIPALHGAPAKVLPYAGPDGAGLSLLGSF